MLRIDITRYATVRELVGNYEERFGELSLNKWRFILKRLGHLEFFQQHVVADQFIADLTDIEDLDDKPSVATVQWPRHDHVGRYVSTPAGSLPDGKQLQVKHQSECKSKKIQPKKDKGTANGTYSAYEVKSVLVFLCCWLCLLFENMAKSKEY